MRFEIMKIMRLLPVILLMVLLVSCGEPDNEVSEVVLGLGPEGESVIPKGVTADGVDLSGMTREEAVNAINAYIESLGSEVIVLKDGDNTYTVTAGELSPAWVNEYILDDMLSLKNGDNVVDRYKAYRDLINNGASYELYIALDAGKVWDYMASLGIEDLNYEDAVVMVQMRFYTEYKLGNNEFELPHYVYEETADNTESGDE